MIQIPTYFRRRLNQIINSQRLEWDYETFIQEYNSFHNNCKEVIDNFDNPNTWDAGWYQIKLILKLFFQDDLREFTKKYKEFEDRMRPLVYELGFLRK